MGFLLFLIASVLWLPFTVINFIVVFITKIKSHGFIKVINGYFQHTAVDIDRFGNRNFRATLNLTFRKYWGHKFGDERETISSALGKNERDGTLSRTGKGICWILNKLDKDHCKNSIKNFVTLQDEIH